MAIIRLLPHRQLERNAPHTETEATYCWVTDGDGTRFLQIDTYGSTGRDIPGKKSQTIRFSPEAQNALRKILNP